MTTLFGLKIIIIVYTHRTWQHIFGIIIIITVIIQ